MDKIRRISGSVNAYRVARAFEVSPLRAAWLATRYLITGATGRYSVKP